MCDVTLYWGWQKGEGKITYRVDRNVFSTYRTKLLSNVGGEEEKGKEPRTLNRTII